MTARPRVIVVDDDAAIRHLVEIALEELPIELVCCAEGEAALAAQRDRPARLLITDLMMPGLSGFALLQRFADDPALRGSTRVAVFSAGLDARAKARLDGLPVWRLIDKPVSVFALAEAVEQAIADAPPAPSAAAPGPSEAPQGADAAIAAHFGGDARLFHAFREGCLAQFPGDVEAADRALATRDAPALRRVAHSLKSVLLLLGEAEGSAAARRLEHSAAAADWPACDAPWQAVRALLQRLIAAA